MCKVKNSILSLALILFAMAGAVSAQVPQSDNQDEPIRLKADLVTVMAAVVDSKGGAIKSLKAEDFDIYENGVKQEISHFAPTEEPFSIMLLLDISGSTSADIELIKHAAKSFLGQLRKDDRVGVIVFSREIEMIADFTDSRQQVESAIARIGTPEGDDDHRFNANTGTSFYDAMYLAVDESPLKQTEGRKAIICMSDGVDSTSKYKYAAAARIAEESEASVYFLELNTQAAMLDGLLKPADDPGYINFSQSQLDRYFDTYDPDSIERHKPRKMIQPELRREIAAKLYEMAKDEIKELADRTGGRVYQVSALTDLSSVYKQVADDLRSQYFIGYYPTNDKADGRWRTLRVEVHRKDAAVRSRSGYWAK